MTGRSPASGRWAERRRFSTLPAAESAAAFTPATSISSWDRHGRARPVRFRVTIDGQPPGAAHGGDVDDAGNGMAREQRLYQLIRQTGPIRDRRFEIEFLDPGVEVFAFTFG